MSDYQFKQGEQVWLSWDWKLGIIDGRSIFQIDGQLICLDDLTWAESQYVHPTRTLAVADAVRRRDDEVKRLLALTFELPQSEGNKTP